MNLQTGETEQVDNDFSRYNYISASSDETSMSISLEEGHTLSVNVDKDIQIFEQSTKADAEKYYKELQLEMDKSNVRLFDG